MRKPAIRESQVKFYGNTEMRRPLNRFESIAIPAFFVIAVIIMVLSISVL
jgi:hypothetical protein